MATVRIISVTKLPDGTYKVNVEWTAPTVGTIGKEEFTLSDLPLWLSTLLDKNLDMFPAEFQVKQKERTE